MLVFKQFGAGFNSRWCLWMFVGWNSYGITSVQEVFSNNMLHAFKKVFRDAVN